MGDTSSADEFLDAALAWFGDPDPRIGTAVGEGRTIGEASLRVAEPLLILDGLEPAPNPALAHKRDGYASLRSRLLLRELAAFDTWALRDCRADPGR